MTGTTGNSLGSSTAAATHEVVAVADCSSPAARPNPVHRSGRADRLKWILPVHTLAGAVAGIVLLHPITMVIYCIEFHPAAAESGLWLLVGSRLANTLSLAMLPMTLTFGGLGALLGLWSGFYARAMTRRALLVAQLNRRFGMDIKPLIGGGENAAVEFKSSLRWDHVEGKRNRALEMVIVKTLAGFLNHRGGDLLIGVADDGAVVGLKHDYATLRKKNRDGFELLLTRLVKDRLGGDVCPLLHVVFHEVDGEDVCRVMIEPAERPVYVQDDGKARYFVRTGNSTSELDSKETLEHVASRQLRG